ncbi:hypothetical protein C1646_758081 [Rhizophagus diaphanus]|nr:hypothetical protein C1646_758081 [Rhizophagus diaphanus] [Rhizophagus sp. MUCL 43196]
MIQRAALEVSQSAKIAQNRSIEGLENTDDDDNNIDDGDYDDSDEENDEISHSETSNQMTVKEIQYILSNNHSSPNNINNDNLQEPEDTLFDANGNFIVLSAIKIIQWDMRKRASDIRIPKNMSVYEIELANVTENYPLED